MMARSSSLPMAAKCAQSLMSPARNIMRREADDARIGTAVHELMAQLLDPTPEGISDPSDIASSMGLDEKEVAIAFALTLKVWRDIEQWFPPPRQVEQYLEATAHGLTLTGHFDVLAFAEEGTEAHLLDWKTGYLDTDCWDQQKGYGWLVCRKYPDVQKVTSFVVRSRHSTYELDTWTRGQLDAWFDKLAIHLAAGEYRPAPSTCDWCPRLTAHDPCAEGVGVIRRTTSLIMEVYDVDKDIGEPVRAVTWARIIKKKCEEIEAWAHAAVESSGGKLVDPTSEMALVLMPSEKKTIDFGRAEPIIRNALGSALPNVVQISKGKLEDALRAKAGKGKGAAMIRDVVAQLDDAGAVEVETIYRMEVKREPKLIQEKQV